MDAVLELNHLSFRRNGEEIFHDLNLTLTRGEGYLLLGASGSGKTLLLKICAGLFLPAGGEVKVLGVNLAAASQRKLQEVRARIGFVFQDLALISNMAVFDNIALPLRYHTHWSEAKVRARVEEVLTLLAVDRRSDRNIPALLSQEMRRRVALARALVLEPELLLLDQATTGLGDETDQEIAAVLADYQRKTGASLLESTSEWPRVSPLVHRIGLLQGGRIAAEGPPEQMRLRLQGGDLPRREP